MADYINLVKLCVGAECVEDLEIWQAASAPNNPEGLPRHVTRMWPKREEQLLNGGSLYWVFKGQVLARQSVRRLDEVIGTDGIRRCGIVLDPKIIRTSAAPRRPFQGWRYLSPADSPRDLTHQKDSESDLPPELQIALSEIGVM